MINDLNLMNIEPINIDEEINNNNNNDNNNDNNNELLDADQNKILISIIIFISLLIVIFNFYQFFFIVRLIKRAYVILPKKSFEECYLYNGLSDILLELYSFFLGIDLLILCIIQIFESERQVENSKLTLILIYINYLVFGPFTIGVIVLILTHSDKLMFLCVRNNPNNKIINFKLIFFIFFSIFISLIITILGIIYLQREYISNSINFKMSGNNIFGYFFWKYGLKYSRKFRERFHNVNINELINNNNAQDDLNNNIININNNNNNDENQNLI